VAAGLVEGDGFAVDATVIETNASRYHGKASTTTQNACSLYS
jgi:hypothetical protein